MFIISHESTFYHFWAAFIIVFCTISSLIYAEISAFGAKQDEYYYTLIYIESFFLCDFICHFLLDYKANCQSGSSIIVRDISKISYRYMTSTMIWDLIPLLPLQLLAIDNKNHNLMFIMKIIRLKRGISGFDIGKIQKIITNYRKKKLENMSMHKE